MYWIGEVRRAVERRGRHGTVGKDRLGAAGQGEARSDKTTQGRQDATRLGWVRCDVSRIDRAWLGTAGVT